MEADEDPVVHGAPLRVAFLALDAELVQVFLDFLAGFPGDVTFHAATGLVTCCSSRFEFFVFIIFLRESLVIALVLLQSPFRETAVGLPLGKGWKLVLKRRGRKSVRIARIEGLCLSCGHFVLASSFGQIRHGVDARHRLKVAEGSRDLVIIVEHDKFAIFIGVPHVVILLGFLLSRILILLFE